MNQLRLILFAAVLALPVGCREKAAPAPPPAGATTEPDREESVQSAGLRQHAASAPDAPTPEAPADPTEP